MVFNKSAADELAMEPKNTPVLSPPSNKTSLNQTQPTDRMQTDALAQMAGSQQFKTSGQISQEQQDAQSSESEAGMAGEESQVCAHCNAPIQPGAPYYQGAQGIYDSMEHKIVHEGR
jgi:hypothetical protein